MTLEELIRDMAERGELIDLSLSPRGKQWSATFAEPDWKKARALLEAGGITLDSVSASCMRHVVEGVGKIAAGALSNGDAA